MSETHTILVVDDHPDNRELLMRRLEREGFRVLGAESGRQALDQVKGGPVSLILLDVMMPGMNGIEVLQAVREDHSASELPVIMVTAKAQSEDVVEALGNGANDYVTKPIDFRSRSRASRPSSASAGPPRTTRWWTRAPCGPASSSTAATGWWAGWARATSGRSTRRDTSSWTARSR
jgi:CheY-like chemotaxis protein